MALRDHRGGRGEYEAEESDGLPPDEAVAREVLSSVSDHASTSMPAR